MKLRTLITLVLVCVALSTVTAQKAKHFEVGLQGGYGSAWIINQNNYGIQEMDYEMFWGPGYNFQLGYNINDNIGVFTEVGMLIQGQKYSDTRNGMEFKRTIEMQYLNIPIFFKYSYGESRARFRLLVGPQFCFLQKAEQEYTADGNNFSFEVPDENGNLFDVAEKDIKDRFESMDIALVLDLGADIFLIDGMLYISAGARFYYGLTDINASPYKLKNYDDNYEASHNAGGTLYLGIHYIIAGKSGE